MAAAPPRNASWRTVVLAAVATWAAIRVVYAALTLFVLTISAASSVPLDTFVRAWNHYDSRVFLLISQQGYWSLPASAFYPLYPALIAGVSRVLGIGADADSVGRLLVSLGIANAAALVGLVGLALLAWTEERSDAVADRAVRMAVVYPFAFVLATGYSESLFLAESVFCLLFARRGWWPAAAVAALLAGATRPTAVVLVAPLLWEYVRQQRSSWPSAWTSPRSWWRALPSLAGGAAVVGAAPAAIAGYMAYQWRHYGSPFTSFEVEGATWDRHLTPPWLTARAILHSLLIGPHWSAHETKLLATILAVVAILAVTLLGLRRAPFAFSLYMLGLIGLSVATPSLVYYEVIASAGRFLAVSAPAFILMGRWITRRPALEFPVTSVLLVVQVMLAVGYLYDGEGIL